MKKFFGTCTKQGCNEEVERSVENNLRNAVCFNCKRNRYNKYVRKNNKKIKKNGKAQN
jgi:hypothetical protein